jgi:hypothetical protein
MPLKNERLAKWMKDIINIMLNSYIKSKSISNRYFLGFKQTF